jgi:hypothetical protein
MAVGEIDLAELIERFGTWKSSGGLKVSSARAAAPKQMTHE